MKQREVEFRMKKTKQKKFRFDCGSCDKKGYTKKDMEDCYSKRHDVLDLPTDNDKQKEKDDRSISKKLYDFAIERIPKLVINESNRDEVYAVVTSYGHVETLNLISKRARDWLRHSYSENIDTNEIHSDETYKNVLTHISAKAQMNGTSTAKIFSRIAQLNDSIWYDLGTSDWKAVRINKKGIKIVTLDSKSPIFRRTQSLQEQVLPIKDEKRGAIEELTKLLRIIKEDRLVFKVGLIGLFLEAYPIPMMVFDGTAGSLKSTNTSTVKRIVDPSGTSQEDNLSTMSEKLDDLINQLYNRYLSSFDNVSRVNYKQADILCRAITGSNNPKRKLYTDEDESIRSFKRKIVLNGVVPTLDYTDLQTRITNIRREVVDEKNRITEKQFKKQFDELLPYILGQTFIILCKALRDYPKLENRINPKHRMSDFVVWGEIISRAMGYNPSEFVNAYSKKIKESNISIQDSYPLVSVIAEFMENREFYENTVLQTYQRFVEIAGDLGIDLKQKFIRFPRNHSRLPKDLVVIDSLLRNIGITFENYHYTKRDGKFKRNTSILVFHKGDNQFRFTSLPKPPLPPLPPLPPSILGTKSGRGNGRGDKGQNDLPLPENDDSRHEKQTGRGGSGGRGNLERLTAPKQNNDIESISNFTHWECLSCNTGLREMHEVSKSSGNIFQWHQKLGHSVKSYTEHEAKEYEEKKKNLFFG